MTRTSKIGTATLTLILAVGGGSAAFGSGSGARGSTPGVDDNPHVEHGVQTAHRGCSHKDRTISRLVQRQAMLSQSIANIGLRISDMSELKAAAIANGNTKLVTKIEKRVAKFEREIGRKTAHIAREAARQQQVEVRCAVATPPAP